MKSCLHRDFVYTRAKDMGPDYLRRKFEKLRREQKALEASRSKVTDIQRRKVNG